MSDFQYRPATPDDPARPTCYNRALDLLSRRAHFSSELRRKLRQRHYEEDEIEAAVKKLFERKFLDDRATASAFVAAKLRRGGLGRQKLLADLLKRGVDGDLASEAVQAMGYEEELVAGRDAADKWRRKSANSSSEGSDRQALKRRLAGHLSRKGFSKRVILEILADAREAPESGA